MARIDIAVAPFEDQAAVWVPEGTVSAEALGRTANPDFTALEHVLQAASEARAAHVVFRTVTPRASLLPMVDVAGMIIKALVAFLNSQLRVQRVTIVCQSNREAKHYRAALSQVNVNVMDLATEAARREEASIRSHLSALRFMTTGGHDMEMMRDLVRDRLAATQREVASKPWLRAVLEVQRRYLQEFEAAARREAEWHAKQSGS